MTAPFAIATRDEVWQNGRLLERRLSHGEARDQDGGIVAVDVRDDALVAACEAEMERLRKHVIPDARMRLVAEATRDGVTGTMTVRIGDHSVVTTPELLHDDVALLRGIPSEAGDLLELSGGSLASLGMTWRHGTAAVLLHEAFGHPREHGHEDIAWPPWLEIEAPLAMRRATFRDVPLLRMTNLVARQNGAPFELPERRVEVLLVDYGLYEPLTGLVAIRVGAAHLIDRDELRPLAPFTIERSRRDVAASLAGATGDPVRYPGVVCSREGQELVVGSFAPVVVTR